MWVKRLVHGMVKLDSIHIVCLRNRPVLLPALTLAPSLAFRHNSVSWIPPVVLIQHDSALRSLSPADTQVWISSTVIASSSVTTNSHELLQQFCQHPSR